MLLVACVALLTAGTLLLGATGPTRARALLAPACGPLLVVGLRGNGDPLERDRGMGEDTWAVAQRLSRRLPPGLHAALAGFPYDTGPAWRVVDHVPPASKQLATYLADRHQRCPRERLVLIGQSEGAAVVHLALPSVGSQLAAAVLLADPARLGDAPYDVPRSSRGGLLAGVLLGGWGSLLGGAVRDDVPASAASRLRSYCLRGDPVCESSPLAILQAWRSSVHTSYRYNPDGVADAAAAFAASRALAAIPGA